MSTKVTCGFENNKLTAIEVVGKTKSGNLIWNCKCICGKYTQVNAAFLKSGKIKSCGCARKEVDRSYLITSGKEHPSWRGCGNLSADRVGCIRRNAKSRKIEFNLDIKYLWSLYEKQNKKCALSGIDIIFGVNEALDRKDPIIGYIENNVWWIDRTLNFMKYTYTVEEFLIVCKLVCNPLTDHSHFYEQKNIHKSVFTKILYSAKKRNINFSIKESNIIELYNKQNGLCAITGKQLYLPQTYKEFKTTQISLDRINSSKPYTKENIQWICKDINMSKGKIDLDEYKNNCELILKYQKII